MNSISKVSDITTNDLAEYIRIVDYSPEEENTLSNLLEIAKTFISKYTGQTDLDKYQDFVIVVLILCQDMYDNRTLYIDKGSLSYPVETILGMHSINLLWVNQ